MIWLPQFLFKISPLKSLYSAGKASLAFLPSRWNILTSTAFLFPKTTAGSCSPYFNPEKTLHPISVLLCITMREHHCCHCFPHTWIHRLIPYKSPFPQCPAPTVYTGFHTDSSKRLENERADCRAENRLCLPFLMLQRAQLVVSYRKQGCEGSSLGWLHYGTYLSSLKNSSAKIAHISLWELGLVFHDVLEALTWGYPLRKFARYFLFLLRKFDCTDVWGLSVLQLG